MNFQENFATFRVTQTQKLIAAKALAAVTQQEIHPDDPRIDDFARMMVIIQNNQMGAYFDRGTLWSLASRAQREPVQVAQERFDLDSKSNDFQRAVRTATGEAARRIRENRARRLRAEIRETRALMHDLHEGFEEVMGFHPLERLQELRQRLDELRNWRTAGPLRLVA